MYRFIFHTYIILALLIYINIYIIYLLYIYLYRCINYFYLNIADGKTDFVPDGDEEEYYQNGTTTRLHKPTQGGA